MEKANITETLNGNNNEKYITTYLLQKKLSDYTPGGGGGESESTNKFDRIPVGAQLPFAGTTIPSGYLLCDGRAVSRTTYKDLFEVIGTTYGAGDGSTTFNLPDKRGRVSVGFDSADGDFNIIGKNGGEKTHTLVHSEMPNFKFATAHIGYSDSIWSATNGTHTQGSGRGWANQQDEASRANVNGGAYHEFSFGDSQAHNNLQPYKVVAYWKRTA